MTPAIGQAAVRPAGPLPARTRSPAAALACEATPPPAYGGQPPPNPANDHRARPGTYVRADLGPEPAAAARARRLTRDTLRLHLAARLPLRSRTPAAGSVHHLAGARLLWIYNSPGPLGPGLLFARLRTRVDRSPSRPSLRVHRGDGWNETGGERPGPFDIENLIF
jgi:hypothetical protein